MPQPDPSLSPLPSTPEIPLAVPSTGSGISGSEAPRPGWGILLFLFLLVTLSLAVNSLTSKVKQTQSHSALQGNPNPARNAPGPEFSLQYVFTLEGSSVLVVLLATFTLSRVESRPFTTYGLAATRRLPYLAQGLLSGILCLSVLIAILHLTGHLSIDARLLPTPAALRYGAIWAMGFALVALAEELSVRGYLQYTLTRGLQAIIISVSDTRHARAWAFWSAAAVLSFLFGLLHTSNAGESPLGLVSAGLAGLVFSLALYRTGSLWWAIGFHTTWDWAQSFLYGVPDSGTMVQHHLFATHPVGSTVLSGGLTGPEGSILILPTLAIVAAVILLTLRSRTRANDSAAHPY